VRPSRRRLIVGQLVLSVICLAAVAWLSLREGAGSDNRTAWVAHTHEVQTRLLESLSLVQDIETGSRGFVITGNPEYLEPFLTARAHVNDRLGVLCTLVSDNPPQHAACDRLDQLVKRRILLAQESVDMARARGLEAARASIADGGGREVMDQIRAQVSQLLDAERALLVARTAAARREAQLTREISLGGILLSILLVAAAFALLVRENRLRLQAEIKLREAMDASRLVEERHRILVEGITDYAVFMLDADGYVSSWNPGAEQLKGYRTEEILGKHFSIFYPPEDIESQKPARELEIATAGGRYEEEGWRLRKDGSRFWANVVITRLRDERGQIRGFAKVTRDRTEHMAAEQAIALERRKLKAAFEHADIGLILSDASGETVSLNATAMRFPAMAALADVSLKAKELTNAWELRAADGRLIPSDEWPLQRAVRGKFVREERIHFHNLTTDRKWVASLASVAVRTADNAVDLIVISLLDITKRVAAEAVIVKLAADLERRVLERTAQLEAANKELESFSYSVSHDLRAPLRHIQGYIRMLLRECSADQLPQKAQHYLRTINAASVEMGQLIDGMLAFSRTNHVQLSESPVDLKELVRDTLIAMEMSTQDRQIDWTIAPLPVVSGDPIALRQIYANLIGNAVKYTCTRSSAKIEIGCAGAEDERVILFVRDNGVGFDMQFAGKLFGLFERLHRDPRFEGTGTGLAIVQRLVARHGGRVWADGSLDAGATFYFTLRCAAAGQSKGGEAG
jgi:PAS domain S-box-containing protein